MQENNSFKSQRKSPISHSQGKNPHIKISLSICSFKQELLTTGWENTDMIICDKYNTFASNQKHNTLKVKGGIHT